jgi:hypothetical protein
MPAIFRVIFPFSSRLKAGYGVFQMALRGSRSYSKLPK